MTGRRREALLALLAALLATLARQAAAEFVSDLALDFSAAAHGNGTGTGASVLSGDAVRTACGLVEKLPGMTFTGGVISCKEKTGGCKDNEEFDNDGNYAKSVATLNSADAKFQACADLCCAEPICKSFTVDAEGACRPKKAGAGISAVAGTTSGRLKERKQSTNPTCTKDASFFAGYELRGGDLRCRKEMGLAACPEGSLSREKLSFRVSGSAEERYEQCLGHCCEYEQCKAFTADKDVCDLKGFGFESFPSNNFISGMKAAPKRKEGECAENKFSALWKDTDLSFNDIGCKDLIGGCDYEKYPLLKKRWWDNLAVFQIAGTAEQRFEQCSAICCEQPKCGTFVFSGNECFLKKSEGYWRHWIIGLHAGVIIRPSPSPSTSPSAQPPASQVPSATPSPSPSEGAPASASPSSVALSELTKAATDFRAVVDAEKAVKAAEASYATAKASYDRISATVKTPGAAAAGGAAEDGDDGGEKPSSKAYSQKLAALQVVERRLKVLNDAKRLLKRVKELAAASPEGPDDEKDDAPEPVKASPVPSRPAELPSPHPADASPNGQQQPKAEDATSRVGGAIKNWFGQLFRFGQSGNNAAVEAAGSSAALSSAVIRAEEWANALQGLQGLKETLTGDAEVDAVMEEAVIAVTGGVEPRHQSLRATAAGWTAAEARDKEGERELAPHQLVLQPM